MIKNNRILKILITKKIMIIFYALVIPMSCVASTLFALSFQPIIDCAIDGNRQLLGTKCIYGFIMAILDCILYALAFICKENIMNGANKELKNNLFSSIIKKSIHDFKENNSGTYMSTLSVDSKTIQDSYYRSILSLYKTCFSFIISFVTVAYLNIKIAVVLLIIGMCSFLIPKLFEKKMCDIQEKYSDSQGQYNSKVKDYFGGLELIKTFNIIKIIKKKHDKINGLVEDIQTKSNKLTFFVGWIPMIFSSMMYIITFIIGGYLIVNGQITAGFIVSISELIGGVVAPLEGVPSTIAEIKSAKPIIKKLSDIMNKETSKDGQKLIEHDIESISLNNVTFSYDSSRNNLENINYKFEHDKKYCIVGKSGSGKTTLVKLLMKYYSCDKGSIEVNNIDINTIEKDSLYNKLTYINQEVFVFDDTLKNNICLFKDYTDEQVDNALYKSGLSELVGKLPKGINTILSEGGNILSGGERQRIGIARAIITGSKAIIFDEVTANLDSVTSNKITDSILSLDNCMCIFITHDLHSNYVKQCDEIIVLENGKIAKEEKYESNI